MRQAEHVLYITLIDFLLQLLFLGMVISVIYAISQREEPAAPDPAAARDAIETMTKIKNLTGISDLTKLTDELTRLGPLNQAGNDAQSWRDISDAVRDIGGNEAAKKTLTDQAAKRGGQGLPSCLPNKARLATFHAFQDRIDLGDHDEKELQALLVRIGVAKDKAAHLTTAEFPRVFGPVKISHPDCRFNVDLVEHSYDTRPRDAVRSAFMVFPRPSADRH